MSMTLADVVDLMTTDKSNDWSDEITTLKQAQEELRAIREELETYRANVGGIDDIVAVSRYARLGTYTGALLGSLAVWEEPDAMLLELAEYTEKIGLNHPGKSENTPQWRVIADTLDIDYDDDVAYVPYDDDEEPDNEEAGDEKTRSVKETSDVFDTLPTSGEPIEFGRLRDQVEHISVDAVMDHLRALQRDGKAALKAGFGWYRITEEPELVNAPEKARD
jgi:hypothetical protein